MQKVEFKIVYGGNAAEFEKRMNEAAAEGWDFTAMGTQEGQWGALLRRAFVPPAVPVETPKA
ncbi:MAG TPA: hypothetical protein VGC34_01880 [Steroidobacteraceae bacterium]